MSTEVRVPTLPESVSDATVLTWHKKPGQAIARDENLVDLETDHRSQGAQHHNDGERSRHELPPPEPAPSPVGEREGDQQDR